MGCAGLAVNSASGAGREGLVEACAGLSSTRPGVLRLVAYADLTRNRIGGAARESQLARLLIAYPSRISAFPLAATHALRTLD